MAAEVGIAFLSASLQVLFDRLASPAVVNFITGKKLSPELVQRLKTTLYAVGAVLNDAENKQIRDVAVKNWLDDLKDAVYVADDFLDELSTKAALQSRKKVSKFPRFLNFQDRNIGNKIVDIIKRLEDIEKHKDILDLEIVAGEKLSREPPSTSLQVSDVYGRSKDKEAIINLLLSDERSDSKIGVIPIVGMGGIGKTTLAQSVYNDEIVRKKFDVFAWICVSEEFDVFSIIKTVIETISGHCGIKDFNLLQLDLKEKLKGKKFLIVLDDVWNESPTGWDHLMTSFYQGSEGSKLIVTTRSETVVRAASIIQRVQGVYHLNLLSEEDCWLIFTKLASPLEDSNVDSYLKENQGDILNKCKGLPLAAKLLGGLFQSKHDVKEWDIILKNNIWDLSKSNTLPTLRISYHYLPTHLKRCFVHCSLFPKDYEFRKDELILLWMAEDLLQPMDGHMTLEEVGNEYFKDLLSRSFFQRSTDQYAESFVMHDLIHDLATSFAGKFYGISKIDQKNHFTNETRHISYNMLSDPTELNLSKFETLTGAKALRTFLPLIPRWKSSASVENAAHILQMLLNLKCMRVLSVSKFRKFTTLPQSICELIHLRFLDLSFTAIKMLPESLCKLYNLQTLKLEGCYMLTSLPNNIQDLMNLRFLDISHTPLQNMPTGVGKLKNLHYLSDFIIGKDQGARVEELGDLPNIGNRLRIANLQYVSSAKEASSAKMMDKKGLESIELIWASHDHMLDPVRERDVLDRLQPHSHLKNLLITGYKGTEWPAWSGLQGVTEIILIDCKKCLSLPPLGRLPSLRRLEIEEFDRLEKIDAEFYNSNESVFQTPFPSLEYLSFSNMPEWQEWRLFEMGAFPQLRQLSLDVCPKLVGYLPKYLPALKILRIKRCRQLASCIPKAGVLDHMEIRESEGVVLQAEEGAILVKNLEISSSEKLEFPNQVSGESLKSLRIIESCDSLCSFPIDAFHNLEKLIIRRCKNLESIVVSQSRLQNVQSIAKKDSPNLVSLSSGLRARSMTCLQVNDCPNKSLPRHVDKLLHNLKELVIIGCPNFKSLPRHMDKLFPNLMELHMRGCPETVWHGEGDMPTHLTDLTIDHCVFTKFSKEGVLPNLVHLTILGDHDNVQCFPTQGLLLPSSITSLWIQNLKTLETLDCNGFLLLTSLKELTISSCPKLEKIAGERLPSSLEHLQIWSCPLLEEQCRMKNAEIWPKISHIHAINYY